LLNYLGLISFIDLFLSETLRKMKLYQPHSLARSFWCGDGTTPHVFTPEAGFWGT
jgi:hypothetical protein